MKKSILVFALALSTLISNAQNLVLNPSIDSFIMCPGFGQFSNALINDWSKPSIASSDYYNYNCPAIQPTVQAPHSGEGYAGIIAYNFGTEYREYITGTLSSPLQAGKLYTVEFYASLNNGYIQAITELGAYLSATAPGPFSNALHINVTPQIENNNFPLQDTANWMKVSGNFIAAGGEQFITIGNFNDDSNTTIIQPGSVGSFGAYYFIDDVSVILDSTTSVNVSGESNSMHIWFDGNVMNITIEDFNYQNNSISLSAYNSCGQMVLKTSISSGESRINVNKLPSGLYFFSLTGNNFTTQVKKMALPD